MTVLARAIAVLLLGAGLAQAATTPPASQAVGAAVETTHPGLAAGIFSWATLAQLKSLGVK